MNETRTLDGSTEVKRESAVFLRPIASDGVVVHDLVAKCPPLTQNSLYADLLQCTHFADTSLLANIGGKPVGWLSAYRPPLRPEVLFVWQIAVDRIARGLGLGKAMILSLLGRDSCRGVRFVHTTLAEDNTAAWKLFRSVSEQLNAPMTEKAYFDRVEHFGNRHLTEHLVKIGPFPPAAAA